MALRIQQRLMLVLPVQLDERTCLFAKQRSRDERVVDERAAAPLSVDIATYDEVVELGLDVRMGFASADEIGGCAAAHQEADGFDEHRLPCACFTREDVQSRFEFNLNGIYDGKVLYAEKTKHVKGPAAPERIT
jgi:hypothetical protein